MPILDYLRWSKVTDSGVLDLVVPPFHTGALGLIPDTELKCDLRLLRPLDEASRMVELHITPFHTHHYRMFRLECTMWDRPGVVRKLLEAISHHGVNIVKEDSCQINAGEHHYVDLILDWSQARGLDSPLPATPRKRWIYRSMRERVPVDDDRYIRLVESILVRCWDDLVFDRSHHRPLPAVLIQPFSGRTHSEYQFDSRVARVTDVEGTAASVIPNLHVMVRVNEPNSDRIRDYLGYPRSSRIPYFLASDGLSRTLRVIIPHPDRLARMAHVAFEHRDVPGVLAAIGQVLRSAEFNIVTSLLRKESAERSTWEVLIEAASRAEPFPKHDARRLLSSPEHVETVLRSVETALRSVPEKAVRQLEDAHVRLTAPRYPKPSSTKSFPLTNQVGDLDLTESTTDSDDWTSRYAAFVAATAQSDPEDSEVPTGAAGHWIHRPEKPEHQAARSAFRKVVAESLRHSQLVLFLSYPQSATRLAARFREHDDIRSLFFVDEYQSRDDNEISDEATHRIRGCDMFVGIWHPDDDDRRRVSPWMHFEYGLARASDMPYCIAYCDSLPADLTPRRFEPGRAWMDYPLDSFEGEFLNTFVAACVKRWTEWTREAHSRDSQLLPA
ncbi:MAG: hypothetical protein QOD92_439 [Acidimicrobiaceae bacterium]|jgi:ACT domain-containing protein